jgi:hypothetical protein
VIERRHIGFATEPTEVAVDAWRARLFCLSIGETDARAWQSGQPLPPTFLKAVEGEHASSAALLKRLGVPLRGVLHAEQAFEHRAPVRVGDTVKVHRRIADIRDKKGGALEFVVIDTHYAVDGRDIATSRQTIAVRHRRDGEAVG